MSKKVYVVGFIVIVVITAGVFYGDTGLMTGAIKKGISKTVSTVKQKTVKVATPAKVIKVSKEDMRPAALSGTTTAQVVASFNVGTPTNAGTTTVTGTSTAQTLDAAGLVSSPADFMVGTMTALVGQFNEHQLKSNDQYDVLNAAINNITAMEQSNIGVMNNTLNKINEVVGYCQQISQAQVSFLQQQQALLGAASVAESPPPPPPPVAEEPKPGEPKVDTFLIAHWKFDEGSGNSFYDSSDHHLDGVLYNTSEWVDGVRGKAIKFSGRGEDRQYGRVLTGQELFPVGTSTRTMEAWVKLSAAPTHRRFIFSYGRPFLDEASSIGFNYQTLLVGAWGDDVTYGINNNNFEQYVNRWIYVVGNYDSNTKIARLYLNGKEVAAGVKPQWNTSFGVDGSGLIYIGGQVDGREPLQGAVDEVRVYNRLLLPDEILARYNELKPVE